jgi:RNA polymerase sigma-70 factor (ECF subfamily)
MDSFPSDGELIDAVLDGNKQRFAEIVRRYHGALLRAAASRLKRPDLAEDVVQETFLCAFKSLHTYNSQYSFRTWLWTILLNQCRRRHRRESRRIDLAWTSAGSAERAIPQAVVCDEAGPPENAMAREQAARLEELLGALPEVQADALRLRFFGGLKFHEIADAMGCSLSSAKARVRLGLTRMSEIMNPASRP